MSLNKSLADRCGGERISLDQDLTFAVFRLDRSDFMGLDCKSLRRVGVPS
jgi:hypothetical protein